MALGAVTLGMPAPLRTQPLGTQPPRGSQLKRRMAMMSPAAPRRRGREVAPAQSGPCRVRVIRGEEGVRERVDREDLANIDQPVRQSVVRFHKGPPIVVDDADTPSMNPRESTGSGRPRSFMASGEDDCADDDVEEESRACPGNPATGSADLSSRQPSSRSCIAMRGRANTDMTGVLLTVPPGSWPVRLLTSSATPRPPG